MKTSIWLPIIVGAFAWFVGTEAEACHEATVCISLAVTAEDLAVGDLPADVGEWFGGPDVQLGVTNVPARGMRVTIIPPPPEFPREVLLDATDPDQACYSFDTQFASGHKLIVHNEAFLGDDVSIGGLQPTIRVAALPGCAERKQELEEEPYVPAPLVPSHIVHMHNLVDGAVVDRALLMPTYLRGFAWTVWAVARLEDTFDVGLQQLDPPYDPDDPLRYRRVMVYTQGSGSANAEGCLAGMGAFTGQEFIYFEPSATHKKFLAVHELGHWWIARVNEEDELPENNQNPGSGYGYEPMDAPCKFVIEDGTNDDHGIRSAEWARAAISEGTAHYIAAWLFDDEASFDAHFKYYKDIDEGAAILEGSYNDFVDEDLDNYRVGLLGTELVCVDPPNDCHVMGGSLAWVDTNCENDWEHGETVEEISSEIDWMRFLWQLSSSDTEVDSDDPVPSFEEVLRTLTLGVGAPWNWADIRPTVPSSFEERFDELTSVNGVNSAP